MNAFELLGIDGGNPLGFLASLGVLRAVTCKDPLCKMSWHLDAAPPRPTLHTALDEDGVADAVLAEIDNACAVVEELGTHISATPPDRYQMVAQKWLAASCTPGMPSPTDYFAAFTCDALATANKKDKETNGEDGKKSDGKVLPFSQLSFSNGASGQLLFKDFRNLVRMLRQPPAPASSHRKGRVAPNAAPAPSGRDLIIANLFKGAGHLASEKTQSMNWDPESRRAYALRWTKPEKESKPVDVPLNVCAFLGFAALSSMPIGNSLKTCGFDRDNRYFHWRLSGAPIIYAEAVSLETTMTLSGGAVWESERINPDGKRYYFAPAACLS